jgi:hypothetical protein
VSKTSSLIGCEKASKIIDLNRRKIKIIFICDDKPYNL